MLHTRYFANGARILPDQTNIDIRKLLLIVGGNCLLFRPNQYLRSMLAVVVDPAGQFDGIERLVSGVGDDETSDAIIIASLR